MSIDLKKNISNSRDSYISHTQFPLLTPYIGIVHLFQLMN